MNLFRITARARQPIIVPAQFRDALSRPAVARELFLPIDRARWSGGRYTLGAWLRRSQPPGTTGVRLQEAFTGNPAAHPEKDTQNDLAALVQSVAELRKVPELAGIVLSRETLIGKQHGHIEGKRVKFGLSCPKSGRYWSERAAAKECHRAIRKAIARAGYIIEYPIERFDPSTGLAGLTEWARGVHLRRRWFDRRWLLVPLLLLLGGVLYWYMPTRSVFSGIAVDADSLLILFDKSGSMEDYFARIRDDSRKLLEERRKLPGEHFADLIVYDQRSASALRALKPITPENIAIITSFVDSLTPGGKTNLAAGIDLAAEEVVRHGRKTTLLIFTDGEEDPSIEKMIDDNDKVRARFRNIPITIRATTPRLLSYFASSNPSTPEEKKLRTFCQLFNGQFGPARGVK
jgi:hypothetical protein